MFSRRIAMATMCAVLILTAGVTPASAAAPVRPAPVPTRPTPVSERPPTASELAASDRKVAAAERYLASPEARVIARSTLSCVTPQGGAGAGTNAGSGTNQSGCGVPSGFLGVSARDQIKWFYCGPAVGQVISNYAWAMAANANKYAQNQIAIWMQTDQNGGTSSWTMESGLEVATARAPRRPADWDWVVTPLRDTDGDGSIGDQLHGYVRSNISGSRMPLAISVKPHDPNGRFHLSSWLRPVNSVGHWVAAYGWWGMYDGTDFSRLYFADSSRDEGGSTGLFWDPVRHFAVMINDHTRQFVW